MNRGRLWLLSALFIILSFAVWARLFQLQVLLHGHYHELAVNQRGDRMEIKLPRGRILDRHGAALALNIPRSYSFGVRPSEVKDKYSLASNISKVTGRSRNYYLDRMRTDSPFIWLERQTDADKAGRLSSVNGLIQQCETRRLYPNGAATPKALGFVNRDCEGIAGIEEIFNNKLESAPGYEMTVEDGFGRIYGNLNGARQEPVPGCNIYTTFDCAVQEIVLSVLNEAVAGYDAKGGMAIVMLPRTGEILSMVSTPLSDPNNPANSTNDHKRIKPVVNIYEPGSTFKLVPALAALLKGIPLDYKVDCENGRYRIGSHTIKDVKPYKILNFEEIIVKSSNIGIAKIAQMVGRNELYHAARDLGFGCPTGIELPGEARGILSQPSEWDDYLAATIGYGQGVSVSALQLAAAYSAVANDGLMFKPRIVRAIENAEGEIFMIKPTTVRRVMSTETAHTLTDILVKVVNEGSGTAAKIEGMVIAGKTGTAQVPISRTEGYSHERFISSFIGFTLDEPRVLCMVVLEEPQKAYYASTVAAPQFRKIIEKIVPLLISNERLKQGPLCGLRRFEIEEMKTPNMLTLPPESALAAAKEAGIKCVLLGDGAKITSQQPPPGAMFMKGDTLTVYAGKYENAHDVVGMTLRTAVKRLTAMGYEVRVNGSGVVKSADFSGKFCTLNCML